jgi:hypothetical protein
MLRNFLQRVADAEAGRQTTRWVVLEGHHEFADDTLRTMHLVLAIPDRETVALLGQELDLPGAVAERGIVECLIFASMCLMVIRHKPCDSRQPAGPYAKTHKHWLAQ